MLNQEHSPSQDKTLRQAKDLIQREIKLCRALRAMISRELEAIVLNGDMDELAGVLEQKDEVISQLQLLSDGWRDVLDESGVQSADGFGIRLMQIYPDDTELPALIEVSREIAASIIQAEDEAVSELEKHSAGLRSQMVSRVHAKNAAASYAKMGGGYIY